MESTSEFAEWLAEYERLSKDLAPLLARYATGGTNFDRKAVLLSSLHEEYRQQLLDAKDPKPSAAKIEQLVHSDHRFARFIEETEAARRELFELAARRQAVLFKIRRAVRASGTEMEQFHSSYE